MDHWHELQILRRSLAMLNPGTPALSRERAEALVKRLLELESVIRQLRDLLDDVDP